MIGRVATWFAGVTLGWVLRVVEKRPPSFIVGSHDDPYLKRWWLIPRNRFLNVYLHEFHRSDDDRALHDHPWFWLSFVLDGGYTEHTIAKGGIHRRAWRSRGSLRMRAPWTAHRVELSPGLLCRTLFITGPYLRQWGFHCPEAGWIHWKKFTDPDSGGSRVGKGCDQ